MLLVNAVRGQRVSLPNYNVVWHSQSKNSSESMPCGGGDIGLNVWVEKGDLLFYLSESGSFDENNQMLKLGRVRVRIPDAPFSDIGFQQELHLRTGDIMIQDAQTRVHIWVDVFKPVVHVEVHNKKNRTVWVAYESWRWRDHLIKGKEFRANSYKVQQRNDIYTYKDSIHFEQDKIVFYHRNRNDVQNIFGYTVRMEGMDSVKDQMYNPIVNNTFGGMLKAYGMLPQQVDTGVYLGTPFKSWTLKSARKVRSQQIDIVLNADQFSHIEDWYLKTDNVLRGIQKNNAPDRAKTINWWRQYWDRSYIVIEGKDSFVSKNYSLFRYQLGCNANSKWPTKFNGGLFTFDPVLVDSQYNFSPDFRLWGGGTMTAQNQRLVYYALLKSGDIDLMKSQFDFYLRILKNATLRSNIYWQHEGACFTEQIENFGLPNITEYNVKRPAYFDKGMEYNAWLEYTWETVLEFCQMILDARLYSNENIKPYLPLIESCLTFYDAHYRYLAERRSAKPWNEKGQYVFYPSSAAESYKMTYNSTTVISALKVILSEIVNLPDDYLDTNRKNKWKEMLQRIPDVPLRRIDGRTVLAPAENWERIQNTESPQMYPLFPWGIYGIGKPHLETALHTYRLDSQVVKTKSAVGWRQHNIFAARLGLTDEAKQLTEGKFSNSRHRFPTFWGPGFDWTPDHNWGGSAMIGLQEMLLQVDDKKIYLLPAWPKDWDGQFKLHAPYNTTLQGTIQNGKVQHLIVSPTERLKDILVQSSNGTWISYLSPSQQNQ